MMRKSRRRHTAPGVPRRCLWRAPCHASGPSSARFREGPRANSLFWPRATSTRGIASEKKVASAPPLLPAPQPSPVAISSRYRPRRLSDSPATSRRLPDSPTLRLLHRLPDSPTDHPRPTTITCFSFLPGRVLLLLKGFRVSRIGLCIRVV